MDGQVWMVSVLFTLLVEYLHRSAAIHCFDCYSVNGNHGDCEDEFGPHNATGYMLKPNCKVGILKFTAYYCVKIKGRKDSGDYILIRTCSMTDWGTQCGDIRIEQADGTDYITGCLASCDFDGCNTAAPGPSTWCSRTKLYHTLFLVMLALVGHLVLTRFITGADQLLKV